MSCSLVGRYHFRGTCKLHCHSYSQYRSRMKTITFIFTTKQTSDISDPSSSSLVMDEVKYHNEQTPWSRGLPEPTRSSCNHISPYFREPKGSLPHSRASTICLSPVPDQSSPALPSHFLICFNIGLPSVLVSTFLQDSPVQPLMNFSLICATFPCPNHVS